MGDQIDVGVRIGTSSADIQNAERAASAVQKFTLTAQQGNAILASVGNDIEKFKDKVRQMAAEFDAAQRSADGAASSIAKVASAPVVAAPAAPPGGSGGRPPADNEAAIRRLIALQQQAEAEDERRAAAQRRLIATEQQAYAEEDRRQAQLRRSVATEEAARLENDRRSQSFQKVPPSARTAANAISIMTQAAVTGNGSMAGLANAAGSVAFGLSNLAGSAKLAAGAAGIGAAVTILAIVGESLLKTSQREQEADAALKQFTQSNESFQARSKATADLIKSIGDASVSSGIELVGISEKVDKLRLSLDKLEHEPVITFWQAFKQALSDAANTGDDAGGKLTEVTGQLRTLRAQVQDGTISNAQFTKSLADLAKANPQYAALINQTAQIAANVVANRKALNEADAEARQGAAELASQLQAFGPTPTLVKALQETNAELEGLAKNGKAGVDAAQDQKKATELAQTSWTELTKTGQFAGVAFRDALKPLSANANQVSKDAKALADDLLAQAQRVVAGQRKIAEGVKPNRLPEEDARAAVDLAKKTADTQVAQTKIAFDAQTRAAKAALTARAVTETQFNQEQLAREIAQSDDILKIRSESFDKQQAALQQLEAATAARGPSKERDVALAKVRSDLAALDQERRKAIADADDEVAKSEGDALTKAAAIAKQIADATNAALIEILRATGREQEAAALEAKQKFDAVTAEIKKVAGENAPELKVQVRRQDVENARITVAQIQQDVVAATDTLQARLAEINAEVSTHAISQAEGRRRIVQAEIEARDVIAAQIPLLEKRAAELDNDPRLANQVLQLKTRLLELNGAIQQQTDGLFKLKATAAEASEAAVAGFAQAGAQLLTGGDRDAINEARALGVELDSAKQELQELLAIPSGQRTLAQNQRITELRGEVGQLSVQFDNAKQAITTWRDLFLQACQQVLEALVRVSSQMLATRAIEGILGFLIGGAAGASPTQVLSGDVNPAMVAAGGGPTPDIGRFGHDDILIAAQRDEYIHQPAATRYYGRARMEAINQQRIPREFFDVALAGSRPFTMRPSVGRMFGLPHFAGGGQVGNMTSTGQLSGTRTEFVHRMEIVAPPGFNVRHIDTNEGHTVVLKIISDNQRSVAAVVAPHIGT